MPQGAVNTVNAVKTAWTGLLWYVQARPKDRHRRAVQGVTCCSRFCNELAESDGHMLEFLLEVSAVHRDSLSTIVKIQDVSCHICNMCRDLNLCCDSIWSLALVNGHKQSLSAYQCGLCRHDAQVEFGRVTDRNK